MFQLWEPRSVQYETVVIASLRALFTRSFDIEAERVTVRILQVLAQFEDGHQFSEETLITILLDRVLRQRMAVEQDEKEQVQLIQNALLNQNRREIELSQNEIGQLKQEVTQFRNTEARSRFALQSSALLLGPSLTAIILLRISVSLQIANFWQANVVLFWSLVSIAVWLITDRGQSDLVIKEWRPFRALLYIRKLVFPVLLAIIVSFIYDVIRFFIF